jgi:DNA polymerase III epsilon subunit-like protein
MDSNDGQNVLVELPDGRIAKLPPVKGEFVKAILNPTADGFSKAPVRYSASDDVINEEDIEFVEAPDGWTKFGEYTWKNEEWTVTKDTFGNLTGSNGKGPIIDAKSWSEILDKIDEIDKPSQETEFPEAKEQQKQKQEIVKPKEKAAAFAFAIPEGAKIINPDLSYDPEGRIDEESTDFTDDPVELAQKYDPRDLVAALEEAVIPKEDGENATGYGALGFNNGDEFVPAEALFFALQEAGEDAPLELARIYDKKLGTKQNEEALADFRKGSENVTGPNPDIAEAFERTIERDADEAPAAEIPDFNKEEMDLVPLPVVLDGLGEAEMEEFMKTKDHTPYLPKNEDVDMPAGYHKINPEPYQNWKEVTEEDQNENLPVGFSDNPVFLAQSIEKEKLVEELKRGIEPGNPIPGHANVSMKDDDGEDFVANVPVEAVRDALQLLGEDTDTLVKSIADEGFVGQEEQQAELPLDLPVEDKPMNAYERLMAEQAAEKKAIEDRIAELKANAEARVDDQGRSVPEGWGISQTVGRMFGRALPENYNNVYGLNNFEASTDKDGKITVKDRNKLVEPKTYENWDEVQADLDARKAEYAKASREKIKEFAKGYGFSDEQIAAFDSMTQAEIADFFANPDNHTEAYKRALDDFETSWAVDMPRPAQKEAWAAFGREKRIAEQAGDFPDVNAPVAELPVAAERKPGTATEGEKGLDIVSLPENKNIRPAMPDDFQVDGLQEIPDGLEEYPKPANVAPAAGGGSSTPPGGGDIGKPPYRITVKVKDIIPGDITVDDHFVITELGEKVPGTNRIKIKGYYPGHVEQDTKQWNEDTEISVIRNVNPLPEKGDLPVLSKPKEQDFGRRKLNKENNKWGFAKPEDQAAFDAAMAEYRVELDKAKKLFVDPTEPSNNPHRVISRAADLKPGDVTTDPKKGHFVIERIFVDEKTKPNFVSVEGYYPGHVTQRKEWKADGPIDVIRNVEPPAKGDLEELHQPYKIINEKWVPDKKDEKGIQEHQKKLDEAAARWTAPENLPVVDNKENVAEQDKDIPNAVAVRRPTPPRQIEMPAFQGDMAAIAREAGGDWAKFRELLKDKDLVFFDFETTGVNPEDGNEPWQVAGVRVRNGEVIDRVNIFMNPGRSIADTYAGRDTDGIPNAVDDKGNKLNDEFLAQQPNQEDAMRQFLEWAGPNAIFGAQNMVFDEEVARRLADRHGLDWAPGGLLDVLPMARDIYKDQPKENRPKTPKGRESYALGNLAKHLGVDLENWHAADADAEAAAKIFNALIDKGIELDAGKDLFDVDARNDEYVAKMDGYIAAKELYDGNLAEFAAAKALAEGLRAYVDGYVANLDNVIKDATGIPNPGENIDAGPIGLEPEPVRARGEVVVLDFTPNVDFPRGRMVLKDREWALDDKNTVLLPRDNIRMRDLLPGDFMQSKDGRQVYQVVAVRGGEDFGLDAGRIKVYRKDVDSGELSTYEHWHGTRLDGVRRPINPRDLDAISNSKTFEDLPDKIKPVAESPEPEIIEIIANNPIDVEKLEAEPAEDKALLAEYNNVPGIGSEFIGIYRSKDDQKFVYQVRLYDEKGNQIYAAEERFRTYAAADAEARAILDEQKKDLVAQRRQEQQEPEEARAKDVPVSRGDIPGDAVNAPKYVEVENLPDGIVGNIKIQSGDNPEKPEFNADAVVKDVDGDVIANQSSSHTNEPEAEKEGRDFVNRVVDALLNPEQPAEEDKPKKKREPKPLSEEAKAKIKEDEDKIKDNAWVEANAGLLAPIEPGNLKVGEDFLWSAFFNNYEEILEIVYVGGPLNRYKITVKNRVNGETESRFYEAGTPIRNVRRLGVQDEEFEIVDNKDGTNRGGIRGQQPRLPLEERIIPREGRKVGGKFEEKKKGFYRDANGVPVKPGDVVVDPKKPQLGRGVVLRREGAQVKGVGPVGGLGRKGVMYGDYVVVQWENEIERKYKFPGVKRMAGNLVILNEIEEPINLPNFFQGGKATPNIVPGRKAEAAPSPSPAPEPKAEAPDAAPDDKFAVPLIEPVVRKDKNKDLEEQIRRAIENGDDISFNYNGKTRYVKPIKVWENLQNGNINIAAIENGEIKNFTISKMEYIADPEGAAIERREAVPEQQRLMEVEKPENKEQENAPQKIFNGNVADRGGKGFNISVVKINNNYEAAVFPEGEERGRGEIIAKAENLADVQAVINRFVDDVVNADDGNKVVRSYAGVEEPEPQPVLTRETAQVPDLPARKSLDLRTAKVRAKDLKAAIADKEFVQIEPFGKADQAAIDRDRESKKNYILRLLAANANEIDRRRGDRFAKDMRNAATYARGLGWFEEARKMEALAGLQEEIPLRPMDDDFKQKVENLEALFPDMFQVYNDAKQRLGFRVGDNRRAIRNNFDDALMYPDPFNPNFRNAVLAGPRNIDAMIGQIKNIVAAEDEQKGLDDLVEKLEKIKNGFIDFGDLPKLPVREVGSDEANQRVAKIAREFSGFTADEIKNGIGDWKYVRNMTAGINGLFLLQNKINGEYVLIKVDIDKGNMVGKFLGNGIRAEEMVAMLYKDLGFAQPAVKIINPESNDPAVGGVAVMEFADTGFFGLQNIKKDSDARVRGIEDVMPEHRAEILRFLVGNAIIGNSDRHGGNFMWGIDPDTGKARIIPIDNGLALFNGMFGNAEKNNSNPLFLDPIRILTSRDYGNRNAALQYGAGYVDNVGIDQAESEIVEFANRMRERAAALALIDDRAAGYIDARAEYVIKNARKLAEKIRRGY